MGYTPPGLDTLLDSISRLPDYFEFSYGLPERIFKLQAFYELKELDNKSRICRKSYIISDMNREQIAFLCIDRKGLHFYPGPIGKRYDTVAEIDLSSISKKYKRIIIFEHKKGGISDKSVQRQLSREVLLTASIFEGYPVMGYQYRGVSPYALKSVAALNDNGVYHVIIYDIKPDYHPERFSEINIRKIGEYDQEVIKEIILYNREKAEKFIEENILKDY